VGGLGDTHRSWKQYRRVENDHLAVVGHHLVIGYWIHDNITTVQREPLLTLNACQS
jgi:hypothetical protein